MVVKEKKNIVICIFIYVQVKLYLVIEIINKMYKDNSKNES